MKTTIISIGDELLMGQTLNTNAHFIAKQLTKIGFEVLEEYTIKDNREDIMSKIDLAFERADIILMTGGLGPTKDDITKDLLADYFNCPLELNEEVYAWLEEFLAKHNFSMNKNNHGQAILPKGCRLFKNHEGTATIMWFEKDGKILVSMPGVPKEMAYTMTNQIIPELKKLFPETDLAYRMLRVYNMPESILAGHLEEWENGLEEGFSLAYLPSPGYVKLRLTAKGEKKSELEARFDTLKEQFISIKFTEGEDDNYEQIISRLAIKQNITIATAESCTGGKIASLITSVPGASNYYKGSIICYNNSVKSNVLSVKQSDIDKHGAVSKEVVIQMAEGVKKLLDVDYAIATSGIAGPDGGTEEKPIGTVWIAIATPNETISKQYFFPTNREFFIDKTSLVALQLLEEAISVN